MSTNRTSNRSVRSIGSTRAATTTLSEDMANGAPNTVPGQEADAAALAGLGLRTVATARAAGDRAARSLLASVRRFDRKMRRYEDRVKRVQQKYDRTEFVERLAVVQDHAMRTSRMGYVASYLPHGLIMLIAIAMVINDPLFVYSTMRENLDVPESTPFWDVTNVGALISLATSVVLSAGLLGFASIVGKQLGNLCFAGALAQDVDRYPEVELSRRELGRGRRLGIALAGLAVFGFLIWFLNRIAHSRFEGSFTAAFSGDTATLGAITTYLTVLPIVIIVLEVIASAPQVAHLREVGGWALKARLTEELGIFRDQRELSALRRKSDAVERRELHLRTALEATGLRAQGEMVQAGMDHGRVNLAPLLAEFDEKHTGAREVHAARIRLGALTTPVVSATIDRAFTALEKLAPVPSESPVAKLWWRLRERASAAPEMPPAGPTSEDGDTVAPVQQLPIAKEVG